MVVYRNRRSSRQVCGHHARTKEDFAYFIEDLVDKLFRKAKYIQLVLDTPNTHFEKSLIETFGKRNLKHFSASFL